MTLRQLIEKATHIYFAGECECGERKFDLDCGDNLAYEPVHESAIKEVRPELLDNIEYYDGYGSVESCENPELIGEEEE